MRYFDLIVPCGIQDARATSLERILGGAVDLAGAKERLSAHFADVFGYTLQPLSRRELEAIVNERTPATAENALAAL